jgi:hypothetical protein
MPPELEVAVLTPQSVVRMLEAGWEVECAV